MSVTNQAGRVQLVPELTMTTRFLPRCASCHAPHPLARKPAPADEAHCPDCGAQVAAAGPERDVKAELTGLHPLTLIARFLFWIGDQLRKLAKGL